MNEMSPTVRYLIICEDVEVDPDNPRRITLVGLISALRAIGLTPYPPLRREFCEFVQLTECRGSAECRIEIQHADSGEAIFRTNPHTMPLVSDPLEIVGVTFRIRDCLFQAPGLYWVQFWYNGAMLSHQSLLLR